MSSGHVVHTCIYIYNDIYIQMYIPRDNYNTLIQYLSLSNSVKGFTCIRAIYKI